MELCWRSFHALVPVATGTDLEHSPQEVLWHRADVCKISAAQRASMTVYDPPPSTQLVKTRVFCVKILSTWQ